MMVGVAQLVELRIVIPAVAGSIPVAHPNSRHLYGVYRLVVVYSYKKCESGGIGRRAGFRFQYRKM